jgi:PII-like signaling protein
MSLTPQQQETMFGCQISELEATVADRNVPMFIMSELSNAQELLERLPLVAGYVDRRDEIRHVCNRVKFLISTRLMEDGR